MTPLPSSALRRLVFGPIGAALVTAVLVYVLVPAVIRARAFARASSCENHLFQHSGWHPGDWVEIDRDFNVVAVGSCPLCSDPELSVAYWMWDDNDGRITMSNEEIPNSTVRRAEQWLDAHKATSQYRRIHQATQQRAAAVSGIPAGSP